MARPTYAPKQTYTGTGSLAAYTFSFKIEALSQLLVIILNASGVEVSRVRGTDTTVLLGVVFDPIKGGGTVTLAANLTSGYKIVLLEANDAPTQPYEFSDKSSFSLKRFEMALDFIVGAVQRLAYRFSGVVTISQADDPTTFNPELPSGIASNAGKAIVVNPGGTGFAFGLAGGGASSLPVGGAAGAGLVKTSSADFDASWEPFVYNGFSSRFNTTVNVSGLKATLDYIMAITYLGPLIASFSGSSQTLREKGTSVSGITLTVNVTKRSNPIARIVFKQAGTTFQDYNPPAQTGTGATATTNAVTAFTDTTTFSVEVTDTVVGPDGGNTVTQSTTYSFVYPYYYGAGAPGKTPAQIRSTLTTQVIASNATVTESYTTNNGDVYYFAYPASYGVLTSILDANNFENIGSWTLTVSNITGLDTTAVSYNIYVSNNPVVAGSTTFTFKR